jgi:hypothetical protein
MKKITLVITLLAWLAGGLASGAAPAYRTDTNPALLYWASFLLLPTLNPQEVALYDKASTAPVDKNLSLILAKYDQTMRLVRRAAQLKTACDWGIDLADGPETLLPHLAKIKAVAVVTQLRVRCFLAQGKENEAVDDLVAAFVLARQAPRDHTLISVLVQFASESMLIATVADNFYAFSPEALKRLLAGLEASPARTPVSNCYGTPNQGERTFVTWVVPKLEAFQAQYPNDNAKAMAEIEAWLLKWLGEENPENDPVGTIESLMESAGGTPQGLIRQMQALDPMYIELQKINELPYREFGPANRAFFKKVRQSTNGFVYLLFPALEKGRSREFLTQGIFEALRAGIQYRLNGEAAMRNVRDPFGDGPFSFKRFKLEGEDRGFELSSQYAGDKPVRIIFVEKAGPPFEVLGSSAGKPRIEK